MTISQAEVALDKVLSDIQSGASQEAGYSVFNQLDDIDYDRSTDDQICFKDGEDMLVFSLGSRQWFLEDDDNNDE